MSAAEPVLVTPLLERAVAAPMPALEAIARRRTHKHYTAREVTRAEIETLLAAAVLAPNHKLTEPWRFVVPGPESRRTYAGIRTRFKVGTVDAYPDVERYEEKRARIIAETLAVPAFIAVVMSLDPDEFRRGEDHAAVWMAVQNMLLAATAIGLGTKIATGRLFDDEELRALCVARPDERVLGVIHVGEPAGDRRLQERTPAAYKTLWLD